jgi:23S rRNA (cytosine1962-C5)-methyltransferase
LLPPDLTAYRVIHGDGDGFSGVNVDRFGPHAVIYQLCPEARFLADELKEWVGEALGLTGVYVQKRFAPQSRAKAPDPARLCWGKPADLEQTAVESGLKFLTDVTAPVNAGLYLDQRPGRTLVGSLAEDLSVLNCFSYTGGFTVYAAAARAEKVVSVDLSNRYHAWAAKNLKVNGLDGSRHEFVASEAVGALTRMARKGKHRFQLAIVDPPTFSVSKKGAMSLTRDYPEVMSSVLEVLSPSGLVLASSNAARMSEKDFLKLLAVASSRSGRRLSVIQRLSLPCDFPVPAGFTEGHYLKTVLLKAD